MVGIIAESFAEKAARRKGLRRGKSGDDLRGALNEHAEPGSCPGKSVPKT